MNIVTSLQQAYALRTRGRSSAIIKRVYTFIKNALSLVRFSPPFVKLTIQFEKDVLKAGYVDDVPPNSIIPNQVNKFESDVTVHIVPSNPVILLFKTYKDDVWVFLSTNVENR